MTLKALIYEPTGGIVAAPTTSLPELPAGKRNWDYRYCWLRDAAFTLLALMDAGYFEEANAWHEWLLRALAGNPAQAQIMYGIAGERRLAELELPWLPGYAGSRPVRIGNAASAQLQLDVFGEVADALHLARRGKLASSETGWAVQRALTVHLESIWNEPDHGIWEVRGPPQHFTHSKVMAWVAVDRAIKAAEQYGLEGPIDRWRDLRRRIHADVCAKGFDEGRGSFVQAYGSQQLDASLLLIPLVGFLPASDARVRGTLEAIGRELVVNGLVLRYRTADTDDGLPPGEGAFLACSFWYVDNLVLAGQRTEARQMFERLLTLRNDVGLLAEEYDPRSGQQLGNFPQAFSHVALIVSAYNVSASESEARRTTQRCQRRTLMMRIAHALLLGSLLVVGCERNDSTAPVAPARGDGRAGRARDRAAQRVVRRALRGAARLQSADEDAARPQGRLRPHRRLLGERPGCATRMAAADRPRPRARVRPRAADARGADVIRLVGLRVATSRERAAVPPQGLRLPSDGRGAHGSAAAAHQPPSRRR